MKYIGELEELKSALKSLNGDWEQLNPNQHQFRSHSGGIINWYPSTGTIAFQGKNQPKGELITAVRCLIDTDADTTKHHTVDNHPTSNDQDQISNTEISNEFLGGQYCDSELIIGLVGAVGTDLSQVIRAMTERLKHMGYTSHEIRISKDIIAELAENQIGGNDEYERISRFMDAGNLLRKKSKDCSILALGAAAKINEQREQQKPRRRYAYIINSLKHPEEVARLREIYSEGFFLLGVHSDKKRRHEYLKENKQIPKSKAAALINRDADEELSDHDNNAYGQQTRDTFHLADFFIHLDKNTDKIQNGIWRVIDLIFGHPYTTPTFDEYAMFMAFAAALRSADLSRQVGAVVAKDNMILSTGANDCPKYGGGLYWPSYDEQHSKISDAEDGRDYMRGEDSNKTEKNNIIESLMDLLKDHTSDPEKVHAVLKKSKIKDITEYGRVVHAEMEAILSCARSNICAKGATLYCTTFPCHNCAKHIIAAGIKRVVYIEPYPKSKASEFHSDSISLNKKSNDTVLFEPFVGIGPQRFFDLFSMTFGFGNSLKRKDKAGQTIDWELGNNKLRVQMLPCSYIERETLAASILSSYISIFNQGDGDG